MDRNSIKQLLESKGLKVNVRLNGAQQYYKITVKCELLVPVDKLTDAIVIGNTKSHIRKVIYDGCDGLNAFIKNE